MKTHGWTHWSYAQKIYDICGDVFDLKEDELYTDKKDEALERVGGYTPREILIHIGTPGFRRIDPEVWIKYLMRSVALHPDACHVISDVRFPNEAKAILDAGGVVLRVTRPGTELGNDIPTSGLYEDYPTLPTIANDGTEMALVHAVDRALNKIGSCLYCSK